MKKLGEKIISLSKNKIETNDLKSLGRISQTDFVRERKMGFIRLMYYIISKKGYSMNMEINNFYNKINIEELISKQALLEQRLKLNPEVFNVLNTDCLKCIYQEYPDEVKTYKGYLLKAIDGSDLELPNTEMARSYYGNVKTNSPDEYKKLARASISASYDVLNKYIIEGFLLPFRTSEHKSALEHLKNDQKITKGYKSIYIMDRGYISLEAMIYCIKNNIKFLIRLDKTAYIQERKTIKENDEYVELEHNKNRLRKVHFQTEEIFEYAKNTKSTKVRIVTYQLKTGEIEQLITNLDMNEFTYEDIVELYAKRWGIETLYYSLKWKLKIEKFTSSFKTIIEQDFFSSIFVYNLIRTMIAEAEEKIEKYKYKHEMTINENMAIGLFKDELIKIMLEDNNKKRGKMYDDLIKKMSKYKIPIRKDRKYKVQFSRYNKNSYNKLSCI